MFDVGQNFGGGFVGFNGVDFTQGINGPEQWENFIKAVQTAGDPNALDFKGNLTGVPAIRLEALDSALRSVVEREETFPLMRRLNRQKTTSSVTEWSTKISHGGDIFGSFRGEYSDIPKNKADYSRDVLRIKYLMEGAEITVAAKMQKTVEDIKAEENESATIRILRSAEWGILNGNEELVPEHFNGIQRELELHEPTHIIDMKGSSDTKELYELVYQSFARVIGPEGGFGRISDMLISPSVQNDVDNYLDPQWRVNLEGTRAAIEYGAPVRGIKTTFGNVGLMNSVWIEEADFTNIAAPAIVRRGSIPSEAPAAPTLAAVANVGPVTGSRWTAARAGLYWYGVAALNEDGEGALSALDSATVAADGSITLTITPDAAGAQTGFVIYRSTQDPSTAPGAADLRLVTRIAHTGTDDVDYVDLNQNIPGASKGYLFDLRPEAIQFRQLLPLFQFPLYPTNKAAYPWAVLLFGAPQFGIRKRHFMFKNYIPKTMVWRPHTS